jgi:hypothetical protein
MLKANAYEVSLGADKHSGILVCYQKEDIGLKEEAKPDPIVVKHPIIKRVEDSDDSWRFELSLREKSRAVYCDNLTCKNVADLKYRDNLHLCYKCLDTLREHRTNFELARYFNSKNKILKLFSAIDEITNGGKSEKVIRCINIYCGTTENITSHHLIPKPYRKGIEGKIGRVPLCDPCHKRVHRMKTNGELADEFNTKEAIIRLLASDKSFRVMRVLDVYNNECGETERELAVA